CGRESRHVDALTERGFSRDEILARGYASLRGGEDRGRVLSDVRRNNRDLSLDGVPGLYRSGAGWHCLAGNAGLLIPVRGPRREIRGLRIRPDDPKKLEEGKYRWLSSPGRKCGAGSGAHVHVARPRGKVGDPALWVTEGELKADYASERLGAVVLSIPGVDLWARALPDIQTLLPTPGRVVVAM